MLSAAWGTGCWLGSDGGAGDHAWLAILLGLPVVVAPRHRRLTVLGLLLSLLAGSVHGWFAAQPVAAAGLSDQSRGAAGPWRVRGRLATTPRPAGHIWRVDLDVSEAWVDGAWRPAGARVRTTVYDRSGHSVWAAGQRFETFLSLRPARGARNPLVGSAPPPRAGGADVFATLKSFRQLRARSPTPRLGATIRHARSRVRDAIQRRFGLRAPLVRALLLGERDDMAADLGRALARTGLIHLFAISGLHVGIIVAGAFAALRVLGVARPSAALLAAGSVPLLYAIVVPRPPVARASWMAAILLGSVATGRRTGALNGLALATLLLTTADPWVTHNFGFQLSTAATLAIVVLVPSAPGRPRNPLRRAPALLLVSIAAQLAVAPFLAPTTFRLPLVTPLGNLVALPLLSTAVVGATATVLADLVGVAPAAELLGMVSGGALEAVARLTRVADTRSTTLLVPATAVPWAAAAAITCLVALAAGRSAPGCGAVPRIPRVVGLLALAATLAATAASVGSVPPDEADYRLVAFDVGQGDALLLESGGGALLIDAGGSPFSDFDPGAALLAPALRARGRDALDAVLISHLHEDHAGGLTGLLEEIDTAEVWVGPFDRAAPAGRAFEDARGTVPARVVTRGEAIRFGGCDGEVVHPPAATSTAAHSNDGSLVVVWRCGDRTLLLTGDAERGAEATYVPYLGPPPVTVLKSPHHGSDTSSSTTLLTATEARHVVISAGWRNRFGLPDAEVLRRYRRRRIAVYRTDRDGAVTISAGRRVRVSGERWTAGRGRHVVGGWLN